MNFLKYGFLAGVAVVALWQPAQAISEGNPLVDAAAAGNLPEVRAYVEQDRRLGRLAFYHVNSFNGEGETALHVAARNGHSDVVRYLISQGAPLNFRDHQNETPMHEAARAGKLDIVQMLVEAGAQLDPVNRHWETPLHYAAKKGHLDVVKYLVTRTARLDLEDHMGHTPLSEAVRHDHPDVVGYLLWAGSPVGTYDYHRNDLLDLAKSDSVKDMLRARGLRRGKH